MPVPSSISDLSATPSLNSPAGTESPSTVDDYLRTHAAFIKQVDGGAVKAADLAATGGSALVGYDGGTAQDVLDDAKPMANYTALRAYTGRATGVRVTQVGLAGFFRRDAGDTTSADNGGTIIVDASGRRWKRLYSGAVNVRWFGAKGTGSDDDTTPVQAAITYCLSVSTTASATLGSGYSALYVPQGIYKITATLSVTGANGFKIFGDGKQSTQIVFAGSGSSLFYYSTYICCDFSDMSLIAGSIAGSGPTSSVAPQATKNNTCIRFNGDGGGTLFTMNRVQMYYWDKVFTTLDNTVNCDNHVHNECSFFGNNYVWDNTNTQAVVWAFNDCKVYSTAITVFNNPAGDFRVNGGDFINPGTFFAATLTSLGIDATFKGLRFENYQNIDSTSTPKFIAISGSHYGIVFENCTARGGGSLSGKTSGTFSGNFDVTLRNCTGIGGNWEVQADTSLNGSESTLTFEHCSGVPVVNQTLYAQNYSKPISVKYLDHPIGNTFINRKFRGANYSQSNPIDSSGMSETIRFETGALNAKSVGKPFPVFVVAPYTLVLSKVEIGLTKPGAASIDIRVWSDDTKTTKIAEVLGVSGTTYKVVEIGASSLLAFPNITSTSNPLYVEYTSAGDAGAVVSEVTLAFSQKA